MQFRKKISLFLFGVLILSACGGAAEATSEADIVLTSAVGTMVQSFFETQTAMVPPVSLTPTVTETKFPTPTEYVRATPLISPTPTLLFYTFTPGASPTKTVTGTPPTATVNASALAYGCSNLGFIRHVNYPDGTVVKPGTGFTKTWKVQNIGSCKWLFVYRLTFVSGTDMDPLYLKLGKIVQPDSWAELSVPLTAPQQPGTYSAYFRFSDGSHPFGETLGVTIVVQGSPTNTTAPVNTNTSTNTTVPTNTIAPTNTTAPTDTSIPSETPTPP